MNSVGPLPVHWVDAIWGWSMDTPQNGWFISWKTLLKWMIWGVFPLFLETPIYIHLLPGSLTASFPLKIGRILKGKASSLPVPSFFRGELLNFGGCIRDDDIKQVFFSHDWNDTRWDFEDFFWNWELKSLFQTWVDMIQRSGFCLYKSFVVNSPCIQGFKTFTLDSLGGSIWLLVEGSGGWAWLSLIKRWHFLLKVCRFTKFTTPLKLTVRPWEWKFTFFLGHHKRKPDRLPTTHFSRGDLFGLVRVLRRKSMGGCPIPPTLSSLSFVCMWNAAACVVIAILGLHCWREISGQVSCDFKQSVQPSEREKGRTHKDWLSWNSGSGKGTKIVRFDHLNTLEFNSPLVSENFGLVSTLEIRQIQPEQWKHLGQGTVAGKQNYIRYVKAKIRKLSVQAEYHKRAWRAVMGKLMESDARILASLMAEWNLCEDTSSE